MEGIFSEKSTIYDGSAQYINSDLSYDLPATDVSQARITAKVPYYPLTSLKEPYAPIEFMITPDQYGYIDLKNTQLSILARIVRQDGSSCDNTDIVAPTNLFFQSLFSQVEVYINGTLVMDSPFYPTIAYMTRLLSCNPIEKEHDLKSELWYPDEEPENFVLVAPPASNGFSKRYSHGKNSWQFSLLGKLVGNVFTQPRLLPPNTEVKLVLRRNHPELCLDAPSESKAPFVGCPYRVNLDEAVLYVSKRPITEVVIKMHEDILQKGQSLKFPMVDREIKTFSIPQGVTSHNSDSVVLGKIPKLIVIGLVSQKGWLGNLKKSPFNFQDKKISELTLTWSGEGLESRTINYAFNKPAAKSLDSFLLALDTLRQCASNSELGNGINTQNFKQGEFIQNLIKICKVKKSFLNL